MASRVCMRTPWLGPADRRLCEPPSDRLLGQPSHIVGVRISACASHADGTLALGLARLLLGFLGLPLLFQRLLRRLLCHALLRVLVLGRHVLTSVWVRVRLSAVAQDVHHFWRLR